MRLDKFLAEASIGTRKVVRSYIIEGYITVNGNMVIEPATEIDESSDVIRYLGNEVIHTGKVYYMFHKPGGCVTARTDLFERTVLDYFEDDLRNGLFPVGRLDKDTEGLLFLTNDGAFEHNLMHPSKHVDKTYFFWAYGILKDQDIMKLEEGVEIDKDKPLAKAARLRTHARGSYEEYKDILEQLNIPIVKKENDKQPVVAGYITISEGRKHQVKRMLKAVGCYVVYLKRVSIGDVVLDESLQQGQYRELTDLELQRLFV